LIEGITTTIERTKRRKTIGFEIKPGGIVRVLAPIHLDESYVEKMIISRKTWILNKVEEVNKILVAKKNHEFVSGESFSIMGRDYRLKVIKGLHAPAAIKNSSLFVCVPPKVVKEDQEEIVKAQVVSLFKNEAKVKISDIGHRFSNKLGVSPKSIDIKEYKSSWGMCTKNGEIFVNWRVIMAPISVINYVIVHELCHLVYPDHSKDFWRLVASQISEVQECKDWLKYNQLALSDL
jgi:predicted metal-dependent hydrolase